MLHEKFPVTLTSRSQLTQQLRDLGIQPGDTLMVHASLRAVGPTEGRAGGIVQALLDSAAPNGTVMVYVDFEPTDAVPFFNLKQSPARSDYGAFADVVRTWPNAQRSANPGASMAAVGTHAARLCSNHPLDYGYGPGSPLDVLVQLNGKVLLLGSHFDHVTLIHLAEHLAPLQGKRIVHRTFEVSEGNGSSHTLKLEEFDTSNPVLDSMPEQMFGMIVSDFIVSGRASSGRVGAATTYLLPAKDLVSFAVEWMVKRFGA